MGVLPTKIHICIYVYIYTPFLECLSGSHRSAVVVETKRPRDACMAATPGEERCCGPIDQVFKMPIQITKPSLWWLTVRGLVGSGLGVGFGNLGVEGWGLCLEGWCLEG